ncbi:MAG: hypothetical protein ABJA67_12790 [Chthonomonadales bacterium]
MKYSVQGADGQWYGPVDMETLQHWAVEGRIQPTTLMRADGTEQIITAGEIGLSFATPRYVGDNVCVNCGRKTNQLRSNCGYCGARHGQVNKTVLGINRGCNIAVLVAAVISLGLFVVCLASIGR